MGAYTYLMVYRRSWVCEFGCYDDSFTWRCYADQLRIQPTLWEKDLVPEVSWDVQNYVEDIRDFKFALQQPVVKLRSDRQMEQSHIYFI